MDFKFREKLTATNSRPRTKEHAMSFPIHRPRRLRRTETLRSLVRENQLNARSLVYPLFVCPGSKVKDEIKSMPGNYRWSVDGLVANASRHMTWAFLP